MGTDAVVRNANGYPHGTFHAWALAHDFENPSLVFVAHSDRFSRAAVTILLSELLDSNLVGVGLVLIFHSLSCRSCTLQSQMHHGEIVEQSFRVL